MLSQTAGLAPIRSVLSAPPGQEGQMRDQVKGAKPPCFRAAGWLFQKEFPWIHHPVASRHPSWPGGADARSSKRSEASLFSRSGVVVPENLPVDPPLAPSRAQT